MEEGIANGQLFFSPAFLPEKLSMQAEDVFSNCLGVGCGPVYDTDDFLIYALLL